MKKIFLLAILYFASVQFLKAADFRTGASVIISTPQYHDVYISAGTIIINAPIYGDLIVTGGTITINDSVMQDIHVAGGSVHLNGYVGDDVRCAGGQVIIENHIEGDLIAAGGKIFIRSKGSAASIIITGGEIQIEGSSRGTLTAAAGTIKMNGTVAGNADLKGGKIFINGRIAGKVNLAASKDIVISPDARIVRGIRYWLPLERPLNLPANVSAYTPVYDSLLSITHSRWYFLGASTFLGLLWYLGMVFILILLLQYLFSTTFYRAGIRMHTRPARSFLMGAAFLVGVPVAALLIIATVVGLPISVFLLVFYLISILLATTISSVVITNWVSFISDKKFSLLKMSGMGLFTFMLLKIIAFTPFFGWVVMLIIILISFGAIISCIRLKSFGNTQHLPSDVHSIAV